MLLLLAGTFIHSSPPTQEGEVLEEEDQRGRKNSAHLMKAAHHALFCEGAGTESGKRN